MMLNRIELQSQLQSIVASDDVAALRQAEIDGWTPDRIFETLRDYHQHPLVLAAGEGAENCLRYLLAQPTKYPQFLPHALVEAVQEDNLETARLLVEFGVDLCAEPYSEDSDEDVPISAAMARCNPEMVRLLCDAGAVDVSEPGWLNDAIKMGLRCRRKGKSHSLALLGSALLDRLEKDSSIPLDIVQLKRLTTAIKKLSGKGGKDRGLPDLSNRLGDFVDGEYALREEALDLATEEGGIPRLRKLLESLDSAKRQEVASMVLPYLAGAVSLDPYRSLILEILDDLPDLNRVDDSGRPAIQSLARSGEVEMLKTLVSRGARLDLLDENGESTLDWANLGRRGQKRRETVDFLLSVGAKTGDEIRADRAGTRA